MKKYNKALAMLTASMLAITPMAAAGMTVFAASITVNKVTDDGTNRVYKAYPIITGTLAEDGQTLTAMQWNTNISRTNLETALKALDSTAFSGFSGTTSTPADFATMANNYVGEDDTKAQNLAKIFNDTNILPTTVGIELEKAGDTYTKTGLDDGWYLIKDESTLDEKGYVFSANILEVRGNTPAITPKFSLPTLTKKIVEGEDRVDCNTAAIGDIVHYEIKTKVPNVQGYNKYFFIVEDNLSGGLTYLEDSMNVSIKNAALSLDSDSNKSTSTVGEYFIEKTGGTSGANTHIKVIFENFLNYVKSNNLQAGDDITIKYDARLNEYANIVSTGTNAGNPNTANLVYSNNPNHNYTGDTGGNPDEPGTNDNAFVGETPEEKVNTYTTAIRIKKVDQDGQPLKGASFTLEGTKLKSVRVVTGSQFEQANDGTYWKLKNGSYTLTDPSALSEKEQNKYESTTQKYKKIPANATVLNAEGEPLKITATVDDDGYLTFSGLNAGSYTLKETGVPSGYNKAEDIAFTLAAEVKDKDSATWTNSCNVFGRLDSDAMFPTEIENVKGTTLPTTGGIGTKLFYIIGGLLVSGSLVLLITKKRMGAKEN